MFERLLRFAIEQRWVVLLMTLAMAALGAWSYKQLPIDAVPDITNVQVQINTQAPGYSPLEVEQRITAPIETAMAGLPGSEQTRSLSRYGLSQVTVIFKEKTDIYFARQLINERIQEVRERLPDGIAPAMGPIATGLGEIYLWTIEADERALRTDGKPYTPDDLREIQEWIVKPQLRSVAGVAEINTMGGFTKEYRVAPDPARMAAHGLTFGDLAQALERNNANVGAGYIEKRGEQYLVRTPGQLKSVAEIEQVVLRAVDGVPIRVADVATVEIDHELRSGAATDNGREVVLGTVLMLIGQNSHAVAQAVDRKMAEINRTLPPGVRAITVYDRTRLVDRAIATVRMNLIEGAVLVIAVLFVFLGNIRAALITAAVIPLAMLFTFTGMVSQKVSANLMSLGALDFGIIVDGAVVIVESCMRRLAHAQQRHGRALTLRERLDEVFAASQESRRALLFGQLIISVVYLPIFALSGIEARMFHPMAFTVVAALLGAMLLSLTFVPAAVALFVRGRVTEREGRLMGAARRAYAAALASTLRAKPVVLTAAAVGVLLSALLATRLGSEFMPNLDEGDFALQVMRVPGTSLTQSVEMQAQLERALKERFPEIERVFSRTGTADIASDPMPPNIADALIMLKPVEQWPEPRKTRDGLRAAIAEVAAALPGNNYEFSQPIQLRFNELISGVRSDVGVKIFGDDLDVLNTYANQVAQALQKVTGAAEVKVEQTTGLPLLTVEVDRKKAGRFGINVADIQDTVAAAVGGRMVGSVYEGDRRFNVSIRLQEHVRTDLRAIERLPLALPVADGGRPAFVPLSEVASLRIAEGPSQFSREMGKRRVVVTANVRERDIGSFVAEAQPLVQKLKLPPGYWVTWGGQFENLQTAAQRLQIVVPLALLLVLILLASAFGNLRDGLLVFSGIPFALTGGVLALWLRGIPLSISAAVGFIALSGVAVLNGLVMVSTIRALREQGMPLDRAIDTGALTRLRPVLMTALVASLGFVPMAIATGTGAEVQRPLATVVIGGILSSTALTLIVLPLLYRLVHRRAADAAPADSPVPEAGVAPVHNPT